MFKKYLRIQPAPVQLIIFLTFWFVLMMLSIYLNQFYITRITGIKTSDLPDFLENGLYKAPDIIFVSNALFQVFAFLFPALIYAYLADPQPIKYLGGVGPGKKVQPLWVMIMAVALIFFVSPLGQWLKALDLGSASKSLDERREKMILSYISSGNAWTMIRSVFLIAVIPAFCEELFFRGLLMKFTYSILKRWWISILVSALIFAAFHTSVSEFVPILIAGIILGTVYYLTSSILMNVLLHLLFNGLQVIAGMSSDPNMEQSLAQQSTLILLFAVATIIVGFCLFMLHRARTPLPYSWNVYVPEEKEQQ